jgi:CheY-like chemotaxis protein
MSHGGSLPSTTPIRCGAKIRHLRASKRRQLLTTVKLTIDGVTSHATTESVSMSGLVLQGRASHHASAYCAEIHFPDGRILPADVQWVRNGRVGLRFKSPLHGADPLLDRRAPADNPPAPHFTKLDETANALFDDNFTASILVAERLRSVGLIIKATLETSGHAVKLVSNGLSVVEAVRRQVFDLIIINSDLPLMNGCAAMKTIDKLSAPAQGSAVIALANGFAACGAWVYSGVQIERYVLMPVRPAQLLKDVEAVLSDLRRSTNGQPAAVGLIS